MQIGRIVDLSVPLGPATQMYPGDPAVRFTPLHHVDGDGYTTVDVALISHSGTHVDAPFHVRPDGAVLADLGLRPFTGPGLVIDARAGQSGASGQPVPVDVVEPWLGFARPGMIALIRTGWSQHYGTPQYLEHASLSAEACDALLDAGIRTFGIDCPSIDAPDAVPALPVHHRIAARGGVIIENLTGLGEIDFADPLIVALPLRIAGEGAGDGSPVRASALELLS